MLMNFATNRFHMTGLCNVPINVRIIVVIYANVWPEFYNRSIKAGRSVKTNISVI